MRERNRQERRLSEEIRRQALQLGFSKVGIARAENLPDEESRLREWLERGFQGEMKWMERDPAQRADPRKIFADARSVIVVALNYYTPHEHEVRTACDQVRTACGSGRARVGGSDRIEQDADGRNTLTGKVSRYAWGDDYHEVVGDKLRELLAWIKVQWPQAEGKVCVDIQSTMDKAWAARAGLGWIGKHTNLITEEYGSWVFIGELLLNLELDYDELPRVDQCGSCTLCLDACPTGALVEPYVLNSKLCISHANIESRAAEMDPEIANNLEGWLYGCDICQDVCPWNQMTPTTSEARFRPRDGNVNASLSEILELTAETYAARFRHSAMKRAKLAGLKRNARTLIESSPRSRTSIDS